MKRKIFIAILLTGAVVSAKCLTPSEPDFVTGKLMDAQNSKLVLEELNSKGIEYSREAAYDLANVLSQKSKQYKDITGLNVSFTEPVCNVPQEVYEKDIDKELLNKINKIYKEQNIPQISE